MSRCRRSPTSCWSPACICASPTGGASDIKTTERGDRKVDIPNWLIMIEGGMPEAVDEACDSLLAGNLAAHGARPEMERGLYQLQYCRMKTPGWA